METTLSLRSRIRIAPDVLCQALQGEEVILDLRTGVYWGLDPIGTRIWDLLKANESLGHVEELLLAEFAVTEEQVHKDLFRFVSHLIEQGLVEVISESME